MSTDNVLAVWEGSGLAWAEGVGVADIAGVAVGIEAEAARVDDGAEELGDIEATELLHPAARTAALSNAKAG